MHWIFIVCIILVSTTPSNTKSLSCNCVAFRLDDIQDDWIVPSQKAVMEVFKENYDPLSVGIIGSAFGDDSRIVNYVKSSIQNPNWDFEVVSHSYVHVKFAGQSLQAQTNDLLQSRTATMNALPGLLDKFDIFIPPLNAIDQNTIPAMKSAGYHTMSSLDSTDKPPYYFDDDEEIIRVPIGASTNDMNEGVSPVPWTLTFSQIQSQMNKYGFAAVMMHPQEFSMFGPNKKITNDVNTTHIQQLKSLISAVKNAGYKMVNLGGVKKEFDRIKSSSSSSSTPPPATTYKQTTPSSTTNVNTATTAMNKVTTSPLTTKNAGATTKSISTGSVTTQTKVVTTDQSVVTTDQSVVTTKSLVITTKAQESITSEETEVTTSSLTTAIITTDRNGGSPPTFTSGFQFEELSSSTSSIFNSLSIILFFTMAILLF